MSGTKSPWESRVGMLLDPAKHDEFVWSFKPPDSQHGGQPRIDWLACDLVGRFWMIEVKMLPPGRKTFTLEVEVSPGQRAALSAVAEGAASLALLAIGQGTRLLFFDWREILCSIPVTGSLRLPLDSAFLTLDWTGPKAWNDPNHGPRLYSSVLEHLPCSVPILTLPAARLPRPASSASTSRPGASIPTPLRMRPSGPSS